MRYLNICLENDVPIGFYNMLTGQKDKPDAGDAFQETIGGNKPGLSLRLVVSPVGISAGISSGPVIMIPGMVQPLANSLLKSIVPGCLVEAMVLMDQPHGTMTEGSVRTACIFEGDQRCL